jgi:hypothetical protein
MSLNILEGYARPEDFGRENRVSTKTLAKYRKQPDGLPYVMFANKVWIPVDRAREWLERRIKNPNPTKKRA